MANVPAGLEIRGDRAPPTKSSFASHSRGRRLYATRDFQPGDVAAVFASPLVVVPSSAVATETCNWCMDPGPAGAAAKVKACTGCRAAAYCSSRCQRAHWSAVHKIECRALKTALARAKAQQLENAQKDATSTVATTEPRVPTAVRALLQLMLQWPTLRPVVDRLESNMAGFQESMLWDDFKMQTAAACSLAGWSAASENDVRTVLEVLCKIHTNAFDRSDPDFGHTGIFLDATLAMANHSCIPNAVVNCRGRKAYLCAESPIKAGDEITISYIGLTLYHFTCDCARCSADLDVYQVCRASPLVPHNAFSFVPDTDVLRNPPIAAAAAAAIDKAELEAIYADCNPEHTVAPQFRLDSLRRHWARCQPLVKARLWAVEPLAHIFQQAILYYSEQHNFAHALAIECFVALHCDPYKYVAPFNQYRLKGLLLIAKTVTNTNIEPAPAGRSPPLYPGLQDALVRLADGALYEAILLMVLHYGPMGYSHDWELLSEAREMLQDVQSVSGREVLTAELRRWIQDPTEPVAAAFFRQQILAPVRVLADLALDILKADVEGKSVVGRR